MVVEKVVAVAVMALAAVVTAQVALGKVMEEVEKVRAAVVTE